jgi:hypothetical protein
MMNNQMEWTYAGLASLFGGIGLVTLFILGRCPSSGRGDRATSILFITRSQRDCGLRIMFR